MISRKLVDNTMIHFMDAEAIVACFMSHTHTHKSNEKWAEKQFNRPFDDYKCKTFGKRVVIFHLIRNLFKEENMLTWQPTHDQRAIDTYMVMFDFKSLFYDHKISPPIHFQ